MEGGRQTAAQLPQLPYGGLFPWQTEGREGVLLERTHARARGASHLVLFQGILPTNSLLHPRLALGRLTLDSLRVGTFLPMLGHGLGLG